MPGLKVKGGGTLNLATVTEVETLDPKELGGLNYHELAYGGIYESLVYLFEPEGKAKGYLTPQPYLAESWEFTDLSTLVWKGPSERVSLWYLRRQITRA